MKDIQALCLGIHHEIGSQIPYSIHVSGDQSECALYVFLEGTIETVAPVMDELVAEGAAPGGLLLFIRPGQLQPTLPGGAVRNMRAEEFDQAGPDFTDFLIRDLIPDAAEKAGVVISDDPDMHFITGGSSCGMAAWNAVWYRNSYFRRAFLSSPTFSAMRGGEEEMIIVRKCEGRPMRLYVTAGTTEPDYFFGDSYYAVANAIGALEYAGYDLRYEIFKGEKHCARREDPALLRRVMKFLWENWRDTPTSMPRGQLRIGNVLEAGCSWEETTADFPSHASVTAPSGGVYSFTDTCILLSNGMEKPRVVADSLGHITGLAVSSDNWRLYVTDLTRRFVFAYAINPDGTLGAQYKHAPFHLPHDCRQIGATDLCVSAGDRVFVATEIGVQGIVSFGLTDIILPLPGDVPARRIALKDGWLYAASDNAVFRRKVKEMPATPGECREPSTPQYGDGFNYSRPHDFL